MRRINPLIRLAVAALAVVAVVGLAFVALRGRSHSARVTSGSPLPEVRVQPEPRKPVVNAGPASKAHPNIVICVMDAARSDHLACYGYPRSTTPNIDRLAKQSVVFDRHYCQYTQTKASTASLFTGQYPATHGALRFVPLDKSAFTIVKGLKAAGYQTALFSGSPWINPKRGIGQEFDAAFITMPAGGGVGKVVDDLRQWLHTKPAGRFFAYVHMLPPHPPYPTEGTFTGQAPPRFRTGRLPFPGIKDEAGAAGHDTIEPDDMNGYDDNLREADSAVQSITDLLVKGKDWDDTLFIVTADHGEAFGEHGYRWHTDCPYDEATHIPLIMRLPGSSGKHERVEALTETVDVLPTIFDLLAIPYPRDQVQGRSLRPLISGMASKVKDYVFSQTEGSPPCFVIRNLDYSLLLYRGGKLRALYNTTSDPLQDRNIIATNKKQEILLGQAFRGFASKQRYRPLDYLDPEAAASRGAPEAPRTPLSNEERKQLKALGYLH